MHTVKKNTAGNVEKYLSYILLIITKKETLSFHIMWLFSPKPISAESTQSREAHSKQIIKHTNIIDVGGGKDSVFTFGEVLINFMKFYLSLLCQ